MAFEFLSEKSGITFAFFGKIFALINTSSKSSLQSSLQNQTKREGYKKDDFVLEIIIDEL